jgi:hypothetical protein
VARDTAEGLQRAEALGAEGDQDPDRAVEMAAVPSPNTQVASFRPSLGALIAASATDPAELSPGTFVLSQDGNLCFLFYPYNGITFDYRAAPKLPLAMEYPGV